MANESEKKRIKAAAEGRTRYSYIMAGIYCVYLPVRLIWLWSSFSWFDAFLTVLVSLINYFCFQQIIGSLELGTSYESYQDILFINWFTQIASLYSNYAYLTWLLIPSYAIYQYGGLVLSYLGWNIGSRPSSLPPEEMTAAEKKRAEKKRKTGGES